MFYKINFKSFVVLWLISTSLFLISCSVCKINTELQVETSNITEVSTTHVNIYTDIVINAPASKVWKTLTDFSKMPNWSSTIKSLSGDIKNGSSVIVKVDLGNGQVADITRSPLIYQEGVLFGWSGEIERLPGLTDNHRYIVTAISKCQTRFIQTEEIEGTNPDITAIALANRALGRYKTFNNEIKKEVEKK